MNSVRAFPSLAICSTFAALLLGCGGRSVQVESHPAPDASADVIHEPDAGPDADAAPRDTGPETYEDHHAPDAPDSSCACLCKNWIKNDISTYPYDFFYDAINPSGSCVLHGCPTGEVCCATSCVDPSVCEYTSTPWGTRDCRPYHEPHDPPPAPKSDCCWKYGFTACVAPELCPSEGVLLQGDYVKGKLVPICLQYQGCVDDPG